MNAASKVASATMNENEHFKSLCAGNVSGTTPCTVSHLLLKTVGEVKPISHDSTIYGFQIVALQSTFKLSCVGTLKLKPTAWQVRTFFCFFLNVRPFERFLTVGFAGVMV